MSRDARADVRTDPSIETREPQPDSRADRRPPHLPMDGLSLPRTEVRERVIVDDRVYQLRGSETRALATIGVFRLVPAADLAAPCGDHWSSDLRRLDAQGLVERKTIIVNQQPTRVVVLTNDGLTLLAAKQDQEVGRPCQQYHAGLVKPREAGHDAQLHRLFQAEGARIETSGGRIERVVLDYELKRDYQTFLNRRDRPADATTETDMRAFAAAHGLPIVDGHLELPDLRIEYETADGRHESRDVELVTEHYSRAQLAGKAQAGFALYRAAGSGGYGAGNARSGGTPIDPHHLEWLG